MLTIIATRIYMGKQFSSVILFSALAIALGGCASAVNTAGSADFSCPGMPLGVTCKTPGAVYKSTNQDLPVTDFDTPLGSLTLAQSQAIANSMPVGPDQQGGASAKTISNYSLPTAVTANRKTAQPKPVREPAQVMRIWIAPWVDTQDTLHLAQLHYSEIIPRTWTVGKPETKSGGGYVIPHLAFDSIGQMQNAENSAQKNVRTEQRPSDLQGSGNAQPIPSASTE